METSYLYKLVYDCISRLAEGFKSEIKKGYSLAALFKCEVDVILVASDRILRNADILKQ